MKKRLQSYSANILFIWSAILIFHSNRYYVGFLSHDTQVALFSLGVTYSALGLLYFVAIPDRFLETSKGLLLFKALKKAAKIFVYKTAPRNLEHKKETMQTQVETKLNSNEKNILLFSLVKFFFLPLMINFSVGNYFDLRSSYTKLMHGEQMLSIQGFNNFIFPFLISLILLIDTAYFLFGYSVESKLFKNKVRSVESTFLGWLVALICYPPFNGIISNYVNWYPNDFRTLSSEIGTFVFRIICLVFWAIYLAASLALGAKCSNLTNRGIVSRGPYSIVRHPAYLAKNVAWWLTTIPLFFHSSFTMCVIIFLSTLVWTFIYFMRAVTEERHLMQDPEYREYCKKVPYRFIPKVF